MIRGGLLLSVALIILASGGSRRLGRPKQLLPFNGQTLLRHALVTAIQTECSPIIVVLGANREEILPETAELPVEIAVNTSWEEGLSSSIRCGMQHLADSRPDAEAVIIALCDQPKIDLDIYSALIGAYREGADLAACEYKDTVGVPAQFSRHYFPALLSLYGDQGAKLILKARREDVRAIPFPDGAIDIDTMQDYEALLRNQ